MARIRPVKPEFFRSVTITSLPVFTRLCFIGLWCFADDEGRYRFEPALLKADVWPLDADILDAHVEHQVNELAHAGVVCVYEVAGRRYLHVVNWHEHQVINRPTPSRLPECPKLVHGGFTEGSSPEVELEVEAEAEVEGAPDGASPARTPAAASSQPVTQVYHAWLESMGETPGRSRYQLTKNRLRKILARLREGCTVEDLCDAARGWTRDPWPERVHQNDLVILLKNREQVEKMARLWRDGPPATPGKALSRTTSTRQAMQRMGGEHGLGRVDRRGDRDQPRVAPPGA